MGVGKITPAHDPNDFEVGNRHNLERIVCINPDGTMNEHALEFKGLDRFEAREKLVEALKEKDLLISIEEITHNVGHSERSGVMIEPYLSKQWFVKMRPLADRVLENQKNKDTKVNFVPTRFEKIMNHWMEITYDWCISRQLWWGHRIPAWYKGDEVYVGEVAPAGEGWEQDTDVLDTWFSSALWPFSTLGWPNNTEDFKKFYPNNVLVTGYDIIPFWVNRMTFQGLHFTGERPFKDCLIHGLIRDKKGRKMSKSLGNGVDPMDVIDTYGADALRFFLTTSAAAGTDLRYDEEKVKSTWNFINKLWNASRFVLMNIEELTELEFDDLKTEDKWILTKLNTLINNLTKTVVKVLSTTSTQKYQKRLGLVERYKTTHKHIDSILKKEFCLAIPSTLSFNDYKMGYLVIMLDTAKSIRLDYINYNGISIMIDSQRELALQNNCYILFKKKDDVLYSYLALYKKSKEEAMSYIVGNKNKSLYDYTNDVEIISDK
jgi:valyl-tRNA synthetase